MNYFKLPQNLFISFGSNIYVQAFLGNRKRTFFILFFMTLQGKIHFRGQRLFFTFAQFGPVTFKKWIKSASWEYSSGEEYLEEFDEGNIIEHSFLLDVLQ